VRILIGYDGSKSADAAIATAGKLLPGSDVEAIVLSVWEPVSVAAVHAARFGGPMATIASNASDVDDRSEHQARKLAELGARLADTAGLQATPRLAGGRPRRAERDRRRGEQSNVDLVVLGARGLAGVRALLGSVSNHVLQHSRRPVLVIPARSASEDKGNPEPPAGVAASAEDA
jgi:nucleotide-binding universal stress UspA family protein